MPIPASLFYSRLLRKVDPPDNTHRLDQVGLPIDRRTVGITVLNAKT